MKIWQLSVCLFNENHIINQYFNNMDFVTHGRDSVNDSIILSALAQSNKVMCIDGSNILRLYDQEMTNVQTMSILEAYNRYGGDAITEAIDKSSFKII